MFCWSRTIMSIRLMVFPIPYSVCDVERKYKHLDHLITMGAVVDR